MSRSTLTWSVCKQDNGVLRHSRSKLLTGAIAMQMSVRNCFIRGSVVRYVQVIQLFFMHTIYIYSEDLASQYC